MMSTSMRDVMTSNIDGFVLSSSNFHVMQRRMTAGDNRVATVTNNSNCTWLLSANNYEEVMGALSMHTCWSNIPAHMVVISIDIIKSMIVLTIVVAVARLGKGRPAQHIV